MLMSTTFWDFFYATPSPAKQLIEDAQQDLKKFNDFLQQISPTTDCLLEVSNKNLISDWINQAFFYLSINFGFFKTFIESFISLKVTLESFNFLTSSAINITSFAFGILNIILFYAFEVSLIRQSLDIEASVSESIELLHLYQKQLEVSKEINHLFFNKNNQKVKDLEKTEDKYQSALTFIKTMNESFKDKIKNDKPLSITKLFLKYSLYSLGAISCVIGEYFLSQYMLQALSDYNLLTLSPIVHWMLTSLWLIYVLITYHASAGVGVLSLINPEYAELKKLDKQYKDFQNQIAINGDYGVSSPSPQST